MQYSILCNIRKYTDGNSHFQSHYTEGATFCQSAALPLFAALMHYILKRTEYFILEEMNRLCYHADKQ